MMKVVIDTNCLIASIPPYRDEYWLYRAFSQNKFRWVVSTEILNEYHEQIAEFYSCETADLVIKFYFLLQILNLLRLIFDGI